MQDTNELEQKRLYAIALLRTPDDAYKAAMSVFPGDCAKALVISRSWPFDDDVIAFKASVIDEQGEQSFLPDKIALARAVYDLAERPNVDAKERIAAFRLYADIMDLIPKPGTTINNNTLVDNRSVVVVKDHGTDDEWSRKLVAQQAKLTQDARAIN